MNFPNLMSLQLHQEAFRKKQLSEAEKHRMLKVARPLNRRFSVRLLLFTAGLFTGLGSRMRRYARRLSGEGWPSAAGLEMTPKRTAVK